MPPATKPLALQVVLDRQLEGVPDRGHKIRVQEIPYKTEVPPTSVLRGVCPKTLCNISKDCLTVSCQPAPLLCLSGDKSIVRHQSRQPPLRISALQQPQFTTSSTDVALTFFPTFHPRFAYEVALLNSRPSPSREARRRRISNPFISINYLAPRR